MNTVVLGLLPVSLSVPALVAVYLWSKRRDRRERAKELLDLLLRRDGRLRK